MADLKVLEEFSLSLAHVIVRLQRAVDHILSLHKLAFERLDSAPTLERHLVLRTTAAQKATTRTGLNISTLNGAGCSARHAHT